MADAPNTRWLSDIIKAMQKYGGTLTLSQLYRWLEEHRTDLPREYRAVIRATIYAFSKDAGAYVPGNPDVFRLVSRGTWGLRHPSDGPLAGRSLKAVQLLVLAEIGKDEIKRLLAEEDAPAGLIAEIEKREASFRLRYNIPVDDDAVTGKHG